MLSRPVIVEAALRLVDEEGPAGLTMRVLAQRLEVTATALYHYFDGRDALLEAVVHHVCTQIVPPVPSGGDPAACLRALVTGIVTRSADHPTAAAWALATYARRPPVMGVHEAMLAELHRCGISAEAAVVAKGVLLRYAVGHLVLAEAPPGHDWQTLSRRDFPHTRAAGPAASRTDPVLLFDVGLDVLLRGLGITSDR